MIFFKFLFRLIFIFAFSITFFLMFFNFFSPIFYADSLIIPYALHPFDICQKAPVAWYYIKIIFIISLLFNLFIFFNSIFSFLFIKKKKNKIYKIKKINPQNLKKLNLFIGNYFNSNIPLYINEKSLYQNILITGTIGSGKTSSAMYPFTKQLISYKNNFEEEKLGMLILDVKGNFFNQVQKYSIDFGRLNDVIVIELGGFYKYNPLHKPNLKPSVLANRLKTILTLFSPNTTESYWLDKVEQILTECIKLCRLYNNGYVTFVELNKLITSYDYYLEKLEILKKLFKNGKLTKKDSFDLYSALTFFENEFIKLDSRILSTLKSEITRITNIFTSDYDALNTFCPKQDELNFLGFEDVLDKGKIVVLNMNIAKYENLSKILAAYLKLDFQSEVLQRLSNGNIKTSVFICDEYHEYVTSTDANFFAQSREAKCINIVATQSYTSILNTLKDQSSTKVILQSLINKLWFRTDDIFTIEEAQKQIGKEDKTKILKSISENAKETNYNYFTNSLLSKDSNISESVSTTIIHDYIYDTNFFTSNLETFSCLFFSPEIKAPTKIKLKPYFLENKKRKLFSSHKNKII